jgi:predicted house-cleaning noncanonical NTP pyrophosphatase (MazG superfamily)
MTLIEPLIAEIDKLSGQVEHYLENHNEECCPQLLSERQLLLEKLVDISRQLDAEEFLNYQNFLRSIQSRDAFAKNNVLKQQKILLSKGEQQSKTKKAMKAYNKFGS